MTYDALPEFVRTMAQVALMVRRVARERGDRTMSLIGIVIGNYVAFMANTNGVDLDKIAEPSQILMGPIFEYISVNHIHLVDFSTLAVEDIDVTNRDDLERFVLSHVYYLSQSTQQKIPKTI